MWILYFIMVIFTFVLVLFLTIEDDEDTEKSLDAIVGAAFGAFFWPILIPMAVIWVAGYFLIKWIKAVKFKKVNKSK